MPTVIQLAFIWVSLTAPVALALNNQSMEELATEVADMACPLAMLQDYGCPINQSIRMQRWLASRQCKVHQCESVVGEEPEDEEMRLLASQQKQTWSVHNVPLGIGFDSATLQTKLPFFYPDLAVDEYVFLVNMTNESFYSIEDYVGSIDPTTLTMLTTGTLDTNLAGVFGSFFGSFSMLLRTTQVDITRRASLIATPRPIPQALACLNYLPQTYVKAIYFRFIALYGTHTVTAASIGGGAEEQLSIQSCYAKGNALTVAEEAQIDFTMNTMQDRTGQSTSSEFKQYVHNRQLKTYGGDPTVGIAGGWAAQQKTISEKPVLIKIEAMKWLYEFVNDTVVRENLRQATLDYINATVAARQAALAAALAAQTFTVTGLTTVTFNNFRLQFGYNYKHSWCSYWCSGSDPQPSQPARAGCSWLQHSCHDCKSTQACFTPGSGCNTGCGSTGGSGTLLVPDQPTAVLHRGESAVLSPDGSNTCLCPNYGGFDTPAFPVNAIAQSVTCTINALGQLRASNVVNPGWNDPNRVSGTMVAQDGEWVEEGCSIATVTYTGAAWSETGGNQGCGSSTDTISSSPFITSGYCCVGAATPVHSGGCLGNVTVGSCPRIS